MKLSLKLISLLVLLLTVFASQVFAASQTGPVLEIKIEAAITPATDDFLKDAIKKAKSINASALLIHLNTPGGLLPSMQKMVENILQAPVPVIVYVSPQGGGAMSAGVFITLAAHVAVMAPGTTIGAAHPVQGGGEDIGKDMRAKMENFTVSLITAIAEQRGRNIDWAKKAVKESVSITDKEALETKVIDYVAKDIDELLKNLAGKKISLVDKEFILEDLSKNSREVLEMNMRQKLVALLSDPNVSVLLGLAAMAGLGAEMYNPGLVLPGIVGIICLVLALTSAQALPINTGGMILILLAGVFFILELIVPSFGVWGFAGVLCLIIGSIYYIDPSNFWSSEGYGIDFYMIGTVAALVGLLLMMFAIIAVRVRSRKVSTGAEGLIGIRAEVKKDFQVDAIGKLAVGKIEVRGEIWNAESDAASCPKLGQIIEVVSLQPGLKLLVKLV